MSATLSQSAPDRSLEQRLAALELANRVRTERSRLKRDLRAGRRVLPLLTDPPVFVGSMRVFDLLLAVRRIGRVKALEMLRRAGVPPGKTLGGLTSRQRCELAGLLRERGVR